MLLEPGGRTRQPNLTSNDNARPAENDALTDIVKAIIGRSSPSTLSKLRKIKSLKPGPQANLTIAE